MPAASSFRRARPFARLTAALALVLIVTVPASAGLGDGFAGSSGDAGRGTDPGADGGSHRWPRANSTLPGIDVSHWQGSIDWARVAGSGVRFVFMKATEHTSFVDPTYATNRAGAKANGLRVGAYHFARPDASSRDAVKEARHFIRNAKPQPGDLLPVLDIETSGGLSPDALTTWALRWVKEVRRLTGVRPLVYTSPYGWTSRFADSPALARRGSRLWIAHWRVKSPTVPAQNWGGHGWRVWQYTDSGRVPGIAGNVDLDVLNGTNLAAITIHRLRVTVRGDAGKVTSTPSGIACRTACAGNFDPGTIVTLTPRPDDGALFTGWAGACSGTGACTVPMTRQRAVTASFTTDPVPPTATIAPPARHAHPIVVTFDEPVRGVDAASVSVRPPGGTPIDASRRCLAGGTVVPCGATNVRRVEVTPLVPLTPGARFRVRVSPSGAPVRDRVGNPAAPTVTDFTAALRAEEHELPAAQRWREVPDRRARGGSYAADRLAGATFAARFRGPTITWDAFGGRAFGKAEVVVDGRSRGVVDLYARSRGPRVGTTIDGLGGGPHRIEIRALGRSRAAATDTFVAVDAFRTRDGTIASPVGGRWATRSSAKASGGRYAVAELPGAEVRIRFRGTGVDWTTVIGRDGGRARIQVDGDLVRTVDLYAPDRTFGVVRRIGGLPRGVHTLRIVVTGTARPASHGTTVALDRFDVVP